MKNLPLASTAVDPLDPLAPPLKSAFHGKILDDSEPGFSSRFDSGSAEPSVSVDSTRIRITIAVARVSSLFSWSNTA
jgi:hypothetical protein